MYTIIVKYYSYKDKEIHTKEAKTYNLSDAIQLAEEEENFDIVVLSASHKDECAVIKAAINEE